MNRLIAAVCLFALAGCDMAPPKFREGDIVRTKIGKLRGQIISSESTINNQWSYLVRFPVASMSPQRVREYEIEPVTSTPSR